MLKKKEMDAAEFVKPRGYRNTNASEIKSVDPENTSLKFKKLIDHVTRKEKPLDIYTQTKEDRYMYIDPSIRL